MENIKLNGSKNIRDLGGITTKIGIIKNAKLLRGSLLSNLTEEDVKILVNDYKLSTIVDLRTDREIEEKKDVYISNVRYIHMPVFNDNILGVTHEQRNEKNIQDMDIDMSELYKKMLSENYLDNISQIIDFIISLKPKEYSVLFHCTEGKDRTGIISAIILLILGVNKELVIEDYLYTNKANEEKIQLLNQNKMKKDERIFWAKKEYIDVLFYVIENEWKGVSNFIKYGLKIDDERVMRFRENVIKFK